MLPRPQASSPPRPANLRTNSSTDCIRPHQAPLEGHSDAAWALKPSSGPAAPHSHHSQETGCKTSLWAQKATPSPARQPCCRGPPPFPPSARPPTPVASPCSASRALSCTIETPSRPDLDHAPASAACSLPPIVTPGIEPQGTVSVAPRLRPPPPTAHVPINCVFWPSAQYFIVLFCKYFSLHLLPSHSH